METIIIEKMPLITTITFNRPEKHNAFNALFIHELHQCLHAINEDKNTRVVIIKAQGKSFCAGADLQWMQQMIKFDYQANYEDAYLLASMLTTFSSLQKPTIALIQGAVFGGGAGLVACADIAIATQTATFCFSEAKIGLMPAVISPFVINAIGQRHARRYFLTAECFDAKTAKNIGLVHEVVDDHQLEQQGQQMAAQLLNNSPHALMQIKELMRSISPLIMDEKMMNKTSRYIADIRISSEGQEGLLAFLEKRQPNWIEK